MNKKIKSDVYINLIFKNKMNTKWDLIKLVKISSFELYELTCLNLYPT